MNDNTLLYVGLGVGALWLLSRNASQPLSYMQQQAALAQAAAVQSQAINTQAQQQNIQTGANLISQLSNDIWG